MFERCTMKMGAFLVNVLYFLLIDLLSDVIGMKQYQCDLGKNWSSLLGICRPCDDWCKPVTRPVCPKICRDYYDLINPESSTSPIMLVQTSPDTGVTTPATDANAFLPICTIIISLVLVVIAYYTLYRMNNKGLIKLPRYLLIIFPKKARKLCDAPWQNADPNSSHDQRLHPYMNQGAGRNANLNNVAANGRSYAPVPQSELPSRETVQPSNQALSRNRDNVIDHGRGIPQPRHQTGPDHGDTSIQHGHQAESNHTTATLCRPNAHNRAVNDTVTLTTELNDGYSTNVKEHYAVSDGVNNEPSTDPPRRQQYPNNGAFGNSVRPVSPHTGPVNEDAGAEERLEDDAERSDTGENTGGNASNWRGVATYEEDHNAIRVHGLDSLAKARSLP